MKTWVLCFRRRKAFAWTTRSRSRWNAVRMGWGSSCRSLPLVAVDRVARGDRVARSTSSVRSRGVGTSVTLAPGFRAGPRAGRPIEAYYVGRVRAVVRRGERSGYAVRTEGRGAERHGGRRPRGGARGHRVREERHDDGAEPRGR